MTKYSIEDSSEQASAETDSVKPQEEESSSEDNLIQFKRSPKIQAVAFSLEPTAYQYEVAGERAARIEKQPTGEYEVFPLWKIADPFYADTLEEAQSIVFDAMIEDDPTLLKKSSGELGYLV